MAYLARNQRQHMVFTCPHYGFPVNIETEVVYPSDFFRELPPRILQRTCSGEFDCVVVDKSACPMRLAQIRNQTMN